MKKRIVKNNFVISTLAAALAVFISIIIYTLYMEQTMYEQVQSQTRLLMHILETTPEDNFNILYDIEGLTHGRVTYVYHNGLVTYDSVYDISEMESHADREEIVLALKNNIATTQRYSSTSDQVTYYCAAKVGDGSVVRIAVTTNEIFRGILMETSPLVFLVIIVLAIMCFMLSDVTTRRIVDNIEKYDVEKGEGNIYRELYPFINKIRRQNDIINQQLQNLTEEKLKLQNVFQNIKEGIIVSDSSGIITQTNPEAQELFGLKENMAFEDAVDVEDIHSVLKAALKGETAQAIFSMRESWFQCVAGPNIYGGDHGAIIIVMDVTDQIERERQRRRFTDSVTHELKTPLTNILGYSQLISTQMAKMEDVQSFASIIESNAEILLGMIDNIISISKLETAENFSPEKLNFDEIVEDVIERQMPAAQFKNITMNTYFENADITADEDMMYHMTDNLISNAIKYNKDGGSIDVRVEVLSDRVQLSVKDTGIGIPPEDLDNIFERFYVVDPSRNKNISSTGLGLSIVKHIVKLHKGNVTVKSTLGKGSEFVVKLPLQFK